MSVLKAHNASKAIRGLMNDALNLIYPNDVSRDQDPLWQNVTFLDDPSCVACGFPFEYAVGEGSLCGRCSARRPAYDQLRSAIVYNDESRKLILSFKHGGHTQELSRFTLHMARAGRTFWNETDILVPVPLHPKRLIKRRYNQAAILGRALSKRVKIPCRTNILLRHKATPSQGEQTVSGRFRNVQGAFSVSETFGGTLKGARIVLVDDVYTTGATLESCARTLRRVEADSIKAITLARVVKAQHVPT